LAFAAALFIAVPAAMPEMASAQAAPPPNQITTGFKGVIGLGLFGAELGFAIPALAGLDETWAFIVFPIAGAGIGATVGYFALETGTEELAEVNVAVLAIGMALIIPTMVITLSATAYDPDDEEAVEQEGDDEAGPVQAEDYEVGGGASGGAGASGTTDGAAQPAPAPAPPPAAAPQSSRRHRAPHLAQRDPRDNGLVRINENGLFLGMPSVATLPTYSLEEMQRLGIREQRSEVRVAVFSATF
jgi:hypothetical protein